MDLTRLEDLKVAMRLAGIAPRKGLGQHFLIDADSLRLMIEAASLTKDDTVLEIGPGLGVMTEMLTDKAGRVVAVETDQTLAELLGRDAPDNLEVKAEDIMVFNLASMGGDYKVVANLPYYITSKIIRLLLETPAPPSVMVLLIQKEVAERIVAAPGKLSILALSVQYYAEVSIVGAVPRHLFWPPPKVDSAIIRITRRPQPAFPADPTKLFRLIKAGFGEKRKQIKNSLAGGLNATVEMTEKLLAEAKLAPTARAQELDMAEWQRLYDAALAKGLLD
jgi:16S rRNA (adenine1518-N6/adenine1519-N6)-dimethyltransferase